MTDEACIEELDAARRRETNVCRHSSVTQVTPP
jgi:hypothetical protein